VKQHCSVDPVTPKEVNFSTRHASPGIGIALFQNRNRTSAENACANEVLDRQEALSKSTAPNFETPQSSVVPSIQEKAKTALFRDETLSNHSQGTNTSTHIVPQTTPDGRILPMPVFPSMITPRDTNLVSMNDNEYNIEAFRTHSNVSDVSPSSSPKNTSSMMAPPRNRHPTVTPTTTIVPPLFNIQTQVPQAKQLFCAQPPALTVDEASKSTASTTNGANSIDHLVINTKTIDIIEESHTGVDSNEKVHSEDINFHDRYQQFTTELRDLHDMDIQYQDMILDGTMKLNIGTAMLLQLKCDMYDLTDLILDELDNVQRFISEATPVIDND
jgi:hypothetical protein